MLDLMVHSKKLTNQQDIKVSDVCIGWETVGAQGMDLGVRGYFLHVQSHGVCGGLQTGGIMQMRVGMGAHKQEVR